MARELFSSNVNCSAEHKKRVLRYVELYVFPTNDNWWPCHKLQCIPWIKQLLTYRPAIQCDVSLLFGIPERYSSRKAKMVMALSRLNRYFQWIAIMPRHFLSIAWEVSFPGLQVERLLAKIEQRTESEISSVETMLPAGFPENISEAIFERLQH